MIADRYPILHIQDIMGSLHGTCVFSKIDLVRAYHQIHVAEADVPKTPVLTPLVWFEFLRMPFGLRNAAHTFQRFIDQVTRSLDFAAPYIDDILVASRDVKQHKNHLRQLFNRLADHRVSVNPDKCVSGQSAVDFLGHRIDAGDICPLNDKVTAIREFPVPNRLVGIRQSTGMVSYYHRFVPH